MRTWQKVLAGLLLIGLVMVIGFSLAGSDKNACSPMSNKGVGTNGTDLFTQTWGGQGYRWDFESEEWVASNLPDRIAFFETITIPKSENRPTIFAEVEGIGFRINNAYTHFCTPNP